MIQSQIFHLMNYFKNISGTLMEHNQMVSCYLKQKHNKNKINTIIVSQDFFSLTVVVELQIINKLKYILSMISIAIVIMTLL